MKFSKFLLSASLALALSQNLFAEAFVMDKTHTSVDFSVKHLMISNVKGTFKDFDGTLDFDIKKGEIKKLEAVVKIDSIDTANEKRDDHLRNEDFFDVKKFPEMKFVSSKFVKSGESGKLEGDLTIKNITKKVVFDVEIGGIVKDPWGNTKLGLTLSSKIKRSDFGIIWNKALEAGGVAVSDEVKISVEYEGALKKE